MVLEDSEFLIRDEDIHLAARSLKTIPHPLRLKILCGVARKECTVQEIVAWEEPLKVMPPSTCLFYGKKEFLLPVKMPTGSIIGLAMTALFALSK